MNSMQADTCPELDVSVSKLAIVAENNLQQHRLRSAIEDFGCQVICPSTQSLADKELDQDVNAWLVDLHEDDDLLDRFFDIDQPVLFGFEQAPSRQDAGYPRWEKRLYAKIKQLLGKDLIQSNNSASLNAIKQLDFQVDALPLPKELKQFADNKKDGQPAKHIWILGSSLGGPEAIKEFLDALPEGLPVGFVYGQHIDAQFVPVLAQVLARHAHFKLSVADEGMQPNNGEVLIVPADKEVVFKDGKVKLLDNAWPGPYGPSIDQLILNAQAGFQDAGVILFSGMGNDGAEAVQSLQEKGTEVWAQSSESCASSAMPDASRETGAVNFSGTPVELAQRLVTYIKAKEVLQPLTDTQHAATD